MVGKQLVGKRKEGLSEGVAFPKGRSPALIGPFSPAARWCFPQGLEGGQDPG